MLHDCNPFIDIFKSAVKVMEKSKESDDCIKLVSHADTTKDMRRYNLPTSSDVSVIIPGTTTKQPSHRDIVLYKNSSKHPNGHKIIHINAKSSKV